MHHDNSFLNLIVFLSAAVICVPISKKLGLGAVLGYLIAGLLIGPHGFGFISDVESVLSFSEFGVVLLLFVIGLELNPKKLWTMRVPIFGLGGLQVVINSVLISGAAYLLGCAPATSALIGMGFSLSSTAIALQILNEKKLLGSSGGQSSFSVLLFQDISVIPMLALVPLLASGLNGMGNDALKTFAYTVIIILVTLIAARYLLRPILHFIASLHLREIFTAMTLLLVLAMAFLMQSLNISMALGAFLAGVLLADSEYRHALETDIEPFKGLLLGLFFISVGMSVKLSSFLQQPFLILGLVIGVLLLKIGVHLGLARLFNLPQGQRKFFALVISQVGEFAFVLFGAGAAVNLIEPALQDILLTVVTLSMLTTPLVMLVYDRIICSFEQGSLQEADVIENDNDKVIIAGFGRFGQIIGRLLHANKITATVLDYEPEQINLLRRFGFKVYYGDATRLDLLEAAGIAQAEILIVAIDEVDSNIALAKLAKEHYPHLKVFARARNIQHVFELMDLKVEGIERETFEASLRMGTQVLQNLGWSPYESVKAAHIFRNHNIQVNEELYKTRQTESPEFVTQAKQARDDLAKMFEEESQVRPHESSW